MHDHNVADREIRNSRVLDVPHERLFGAFSDPDPLSRWCGPKDFAKTFHAFDLRPGGTWRFVMHGPDGVDHPNENVFVEVVEPERIVFRHVSAPPFRMTITFEDLGGRTRLGWRMRFATAAECRKVREICVDGNEQNFDRIQVQLAKTAS